MTDYPEMLDAIKSDTVGLVRAFLRHFPVVLWASVDTQDRP